MGCIRVKKIVEHLIEPLRTTVKDKDPYVRKTAAIAVAKLFDLDPDLCIEQGFVDLLEEMLSDSNPMVIANAVAALSEITTSTSEIKLTYNSKTVKSLCQALGECTEWGQIFILDSLADYTPKSEKEASMIAEKVVPRLQHANAAVVLSAIKVLLRMENFINDEAQCASIENKMSAPLITLLNSEQEIKYVALRNINLIVQKVDGVLKNRVDTFYCSYSDPIYVKLEKIEIMVQLTNVENVNDVLHEFREYAKEIDVEFARRAVRAIGRIAIKIEEAAPKCIKVLEDLINSKANYVVQEVVVVIKDIFRKYPNRYEMIISKLCENLNTLDEPEAKSAMIWIIGDYADRIENADELLELFVDTFHDEDSQVQLALLTACVKLYLKNQSEASEQLVKEVLVLSTEKSSNPDLRDRGYVYWRLLTEVNDTSIASRVVLSEKPTISDSSSTLATNLLEELLQNIGTLASIYHKPPQMFVPNYSKSGENDDDEEEEVIDDQDQEDDIVDMEHEGTDGLENKNAIDILGEFMGGSDTSSTNTPSEPTQGGGMLGLDEFLGGSTTSSQQGPSGSPQPISRTLIVDPSGKGQGLEVSGRLIADGGKIFYDCEIANRSNEVISDFAMKFNSNTFALMPGRINCNPLQPGQSQDVKIEVRQMFDRQQGDSITNDVAIAVRHNGVIKYGGDSRVNLLALFHPTININPNDFLEEWKSMSEKTSSAPQRYSSEGINSFFSDNGLHFVRDYKKSGALCLYFGGKIKYSGEVMSILVKIECPENGSNLDIAVRSPNSEISGLFANYIASLL
eukprot:CAMPEP_0117428390 /NCGR_PEP_ID=MMETSP0758-20121206/8110_1 /TAXON_ID=63605 /ORGANISM="Percolomonas cosmopolitus, Strain AE-1 (ATCC 50343)" /LENGTH=796 /DNA_ID=CAMNT_0005214723 /DNA_START=341 /DNA_END=2731 /DNA_ORIENTATION=-